MCEGSSITVNTDAGLAECERGNNNDLPIKECTLNICGCECLHQFFHFPVRPSQ